MKKEEVYNQLIEAEAKEEMNEEEIADVLYKAFVADSPAFIQINVMRNGNCYRDLECKVSGYAENRIHLLLKDGWVTSCTLKEIRNVEVMSFLDWYDMIKEIDKLYKSRLLLFLCIDS